MKQLRLMWAYAWKTGVLSIWLTGRSSSICIVGSWIFPYEGLRVFSEGKYKQSTLRSYAFAGEAKLAELRTKPSYEILPRSGQPRSVDNVLRSMWDICSHLNKRDKGSSEAKLGRVQEARQVEPAPHGIHVHPIQRSQEWGKTCYTPLGQPWITALNIEVY